MRKKYVSPIVEALGLELEDVLYDSELDNEFGVNDDDDPEWGDGDFDEEEEFGFGF